MLETGSCHADLDGLEFAFRPDWPGLAWLYLPRAVFTGLTLLCRAEISLQQREGAGLKPLGLGVVGGAGSLEPTTLERVRSALPQPRKEGTRSLQDQRLSLWGCEGHWGTL